MRALLDQPNVTFYPGVSGQRLDALYREASIFVMPSLVEGFGLVYLEALAVGLHCIGTMNTGLPDLHLQPECASIVAVGDIQNLAEALAASADNVRRGAIRKENVKKCVAALTWDIRRAELRSAIARMVG
jgi:glycosyltransferase involved in cell wall biosynthesis